MGLVIGVTGGIGTGKTTVTDFLRQRYGCEILDADVLAREAVAPGSEGLDAIARRYGLTMLRPDGTLDRSRLGRLVFD
ncbi:MAG: dephospho-CoA kinase, partial [Cyanobacteria bacterium P01_F01_bin.153]